MEKFVSYEKLSKRKQREICKMKRMTWGDIKPITRKTENKKAYNRKKAQRRMDDFCDVPFNFMLFAK